jgi:hypothetical protein
MKKIKKADRELFERIVKLTKATTDDKKVMAMLYKNYINDKYSICFTCDHQIRAIHNRLKTYYKNYGPEGKAT